MNMRTRLKRGAIGALVALLVFGAGAFADNHTSDQESVTVTVVDGTRVLQVSDVDSAGTAPDPTGSATLAFREDSTSVPFGVSVTDVAYSRVGYSVTAMLTNLHPYDAVNDQFDCTDPDHISSGSFSLDFVSNAADALLDDVSAHVEPTVNFVVTASELNTILGPLLGTVTVSGDQTVTTVGTLVHDVTSSSALMAITDGTAGLAFDNPATHACGTGDDSTARQRVLQTGTPDDSPASTLASNLFAAAKDDDGTDGDADTVNPTEAIGDGWFLTGADESGGEIWNETETVLQNLLVDLLGTSTGLTDAIIADTVSELDASVAPVLDLLGQTGAYVNVPMLNLDTAALDGKTTGVYQGTMTITLTDAG